MNNTPTTSATSIISQAGLLTLFLIVAAIASVILIINTRLATAWYMVLITLALFTFICGQVVTGRKLGALIDDRNVMSLSRFQTVLWALLILSAFLTAALHNILLEHNLLDESLKSKGALSIGIQEELWWLMGIATTSLVGSTLILSDKATKTPDLSEVGTTMGRTATSPTMGNREKTIPPHTRLTY